MNLPLKALSSALLFTAALDARAAEKPAVSNPIADADLKAWVDQRVDERQPTADDRRFDQIGWFKDIRTGEKMARDHNRPLFLFTHDGRMNIGRC
jgi:hypothetical protein